MRKINIQRKEKRLLSVLACFIILATSVQLFILPKLKKMKLLDLEKINVKSQIDELWQNAIDIDELTENVDNLKTEVEDYKNKYGGNYFTNEIDTLFTSVANELEIESDSMTIKIDKKNIQSYEEAQKEKENTENESNEGNVFVYTVEQKLLSSQKEVFNIYIQKMQQNNKVKLKNFSIQFIEKDNKYSCDVTFEFYFYNGD